MLSFLILVMPANLSNRFIGNDEVEPWMEQINSTEVDNQKTWAAYSTLRVLGQKENHGLPVRCVTVHPSNLTPVSVETRLDIECTCTIRLSKTMNTNFTP